MKQTKQAGAAALPKSGYFAMVCILIAGSLWGCLGLFNRHLSALGIAPETVVMLRNLGACLILGLIFLVYDRSIFRIRLRHLPIFLCSGLISILFFTLCYFRSQQVSSLAVAAILLYTAPTFVVILSALLWKDRITKRKLAALVLAFLATSVYFGLMAAYGATTHKDLSGWGPKLMMALVALLITGFVGMLFGMGFGSTVLYSGIGLVVFMLLTAYDTQKLSQLYSYYAGDSELAEKASIYGALTLYLDFINIFLYVVRLLGLNSRNSRS